MGTQGAVIGISVHAPRTRRGVPIPTIQLWMGHKVMATTMRYLRPSRSPEARAKFNATFSGV